MKHSVRIGLTVFFTLVVAALVIISRIRHERQIQELGDAWLIAQLDAQCAL